MQFHRCYINGMQDTMAIWEAGLVYCSYCEIRGSVDFIYGGGPAFHSCNIKQERATGSVNTAPRHPLSMPYGFVFNACKINKPPASEPSNCTLMRPGAITARRAYINYTMDNHITAHRLGRVGRSRSQPAARPSMAARRSTGATIDLSKRASWVRRLDRLEGDGLFGDNVLRQLGAPSLIHLYTPLR
ncbi:MAG: pectinesterase family protein [Nibricoccus sp.]